VATKGPTFVKVDLPDVLCLYDDIAHGPPELKGN